MLLDASKGHLAGGTIDNQVKSMFASTKGRTTSEKESDVTKSASILAE